MLENITFRNEKNHGNLVQSSSNTHEENHKSF